MQSGTPQMMARVMACLTSSDTGSLTAAELVQAREILHTKPGATEPDLT